MPREDAPEPEHGIVVHLDRLLKERGKPLTWLEEVTGISYANLSKLKNGRARAAWFTSLGRLCEALDCQPGDILTYRQAPSPSGAPRSDSGAAPRPAGGVPQGAAQAPKTPYSRPKMLQRAPAGTSGTTEDGEPDQDETRRRT